MSRFVYLDYQATTPADPQVVQAMLPFFTDKFGNPASAHRKGMEAELAVTKARRVVAEILQVQAKEIFFTSGASEGNNLAIKGVLKTYKKGHIITAATEHKCVLNTCYRLAQEGFSLTVLPVDTKGLINLDQLKDALQPDTILISVMYGNNETGVLQPIQAIGEIAKEKGIFLHCDATQSIGYLPLNPAKWGIHLLTFSGHKIYGPKGIGALYIAEELLQTHRIQCEIDGGGQEKGIRSGTLNVPGIIGLQKALELVNQRYATAPQHLSGLRALLLQALDKKVNYLCNTPLEQSLPHCLNLTFLGVDGQRFLQNLAELGISTTSACNSEAQSVSYVLHAMQLPPEQISSSVRLSIGRYTTIEEVNFAIERLLAAYQIAQI